MAHDQPEQELLSLKAAASKLGVHPATLRRWADNGDVLVMITPGGHRRFPKREIERLASIGSRTDDLGAHLVESAVERTREEITQHPDIGWITALGEEQRDHLRAMGRRVMLLLEQFVDMGDDGAALIDEASSMGRDYAASTKEVGMSMPDVLQAVAFFRDRILESAVSIPDVATMDAEANTQLVRRINTFLNTILLSVAEAYEQA